MTAAALLAATVFRRRTKRLREQARRERLQRTRDAENAIKELPWELQTAWALAYGMQAEAASGIPLCIEDNSADNPDLAFVPDARQVFGGRDDWSRRARPALTAVPDDGAA